ncbi:MAG: hypothetical protein JOS17DRAFT_795352 [Linnemannia elongata]|nr:MAG: hypothetical protein JOS17DRAFT_795352 [Linnemannia elongata]
MACPEWRSSVEGPASYYRPTGTRKISSRDLRQQQAAEFGDIVTLGARWIWLSCTRALKSPISSSNGLESARWISPSGAGRIFDLSDAFRSSTDSMVCRSHRSSWGMWQLTRMGEVWVGGTTSPSTVHLLTTPREFEMFFESTSLAQIFNFMEHLEREGPKIKRQQERYNRAKDTGSYSQAVASPRPTTPPPKRKPFDQNVGLSDAATITLSFNAADVK